ncbi:MAG TPA: hypothetical protein PLX60_13505, partial [Chitinophagales bacterium]|nr:hypothetical protein [Chitinophagales bacterium]
TMTEAKKQQLFTVLNTALQNNKSSVNALELAIEELQNKPTSKKSRADKNIEKFRLTKKYK